jgi:L-threonylcarbamoyladenylate synthase
VLVVDGEHPEPGTIAAAAGVIRARGLVAFPTETFYGLGADALVPAAVTRVFQVKGRPETKPLLVLVASLAMVESLAEGIPSQARAAIDRHWPGPLTLVFRARPGAGTALTAGTGTIGVRMPGHPVALALVRAAGVPVTAPSANRSGAPPPTTAGQVLAAFEGAIDVVLDGGPTAGGPPSTIVDMTVDPPVLLRAGAVAF